MLMLSTTHNQSTTDTNPKPRLRNDSGQGLVEYLIIVALMGVATIGIVRIMSQTVSSRFATITYALQGKKQSASPEAVDENTYKKKDLGNFFDGVGGKGGSGTSN
jgi:pilus assembly protein Flp/PilA